MSDELTKAIEAARSAAMTDAEREAQRQSFAYGNSNFENPAITREMVAEQSHLLQPDPEMARQSLEAMRAGDYQTSQEYLAELRAARR